MNPPELTGDQRRAKARRIRAGSVVRDDYGDYLFVAQVLAPEFAPDCVMVACLRWRGDKANAMCWVIDFVEPDARLAPVDFSPWWWRTAARLRATLAGLLALST